MLNILIVILFIYSGIVTDTKGSPLPYTTVYSEMHPEYGTATGPDGRFVLEASDEIYGDLIFSFIGYEKKSLNAFPFLTSGGDIDLSGQTQQVVKLKEQPIALEEMVISSKRQRNKRKVMKTLLEEVWQQMQRDYDSTQVSYKIVSDVRMDQYEQPWGVEQMLAHTYEMPYAKHNGQDSMYFWMDNRRRFLHEGLREKADNFKQSEAIQRMDKKGKKYYDLIWTVQNVDSGVVVHRSLWNMGNMRATFVHNRKHVNRWRIDRENEGQTVLTYQEDHNLLGIFKVNFSNHYILNSEDLSVERFSQQGEVWVNIPFGYKLSEDELEFFDLMNINPEKVKRFRVKKMHATLSMNTIYTSIDPATKNPFPGNRKFKQERNLIVNGTVEGTNRDMPKGKRDVEMPIHVSATQRATTIRPHIDWTKGAKKTTKTVKK